MAHKRGTLSYRGRVSYLVTVTAVAVLMVMGLLAASHIHAATSINCSTSPHICGFPDSTNTGPSGSLTLITSSSTSGSGWTCNSPCSVVHVTGNVSNVELASGIEAWTNASNITITNFKTDHGGIDICGNTNAAHCNGTPAVNVTISHCDIGGASTGDPFLTASTPEFGVLVLNGHSSLTVDHCNIHGFEEGIQYSTEQGNDVFSNNYVHDFHCGTGAPSSCQGHLNAIYYGGNNQATTNSLLEQHNTLVMDSPCCGSDVISFFDDSGSNNVKNMHALVSDNLIESTAGLCINGDDNTAGGPTYLQIQNNRYGHVNGTGSICNVGLIRGSSTWSGIPFTGTGNSSCGNIWDDGPMAGSGADQSNSYPKSMQPITSCSGGAPTPAPSKPAAASATPASASKPPALAAPAPSEQVTVVNGVTIITKTVPQKASSAAPIVLAPAALAVGAGVTISRVVYAIDNKAFGQSTTPPFELKVDPYRLKNGRHSVYIRSYTSDGRMVVTKQTINVYIPLYKRWGHWLWTPVRALRAKIKAKI